MVIKITRKVPPQQTSEVAAGGLTPTTPKVLTEAERQFKEFIPQHDAQRTMCQFCEKPYLKPCIAEVHESCANWQVLQIRKAGGKVLPK